MDIILGAVFFIGGIILGAFLLVGYICSRMVGSDGWDDSNITNALRLLSHVTLHPEDFGKMYYLVGFDGESAHIDRRPFWYVSEDEFEGVVKTRPPR
jgi:hypothetical protein